MTSPASVGCVILAAGLSSRMGIPKALLRWGEETLIEHMIRTAQAADVGAVSVITGHSADLITSLVMALGAHPSHNIDYAKGGLLSSLKTGLHAQPDSCQAVLVLLGDMPFITAKTIQTVAAVWRAERPTTAIVAPIFNGQRGHPILFDFAVWPELLALPDGSAPRAVLQTQPERLRLIPVEDEGILIDIDTPQDYHRLRKSP